MPYNPDELQIRTEAQLLEDFSGGQPEQGKMLNLIHTVFNSGNEGVTSVNGQTGDVTLTPPDIVGEVTYSSTAFATEALGISREALGPQAFGVAFVIVGDSGVPFVAGLRDVVPYSASGSPPANALPQHGTGGRLRVGTPFADTDATTKAYVDGRLSAAQRLAIDALTSSSTAADIVAALQAT